MFDLGDQIAGYRLKSVLGRGGMGIVYEATQLSLNRSVALKVIAPGVSTDSAFRERFRREGPLQARIDHPHIVSVFEAGEWEGHLFLAMRLVRGPCLRDLLREQPLEPERALRILTPVADALDTAHEESLIHRDVKPHNILIGRGDHSFLADFGLTKSAGEHSLTKTGHFVGTLDYIAPEQVQGEDASRASDIYALAAVLYETLTGSPPFSRASDAATLYAHVADPPPRPSEARPSLGPEIDAVIARGLAKNPRERPVTALELMDEAERALHAGSARLAPDPVAEPVAPPPRRAPRRNATTDVLPEPDLSARTVTDTDEEPVRRHADPAPEPDPAPAGRLPVPAATLADSRAAPAPGAPTAGDLPVPAPAPAAPAAPASRRDGPPRALAAAAALVVAALVVAGGFLAGSGLGEEPPAGEARRTVAAPALAIAVPSAWVARRPAPMIEGLALEDPVAYGPRGSQAAVLVAGIAADGAGPTLLAPSFRRRLAAEPSRQDRVVLAGGLQAQRYAALLPRGAETRLTLLVVPTDAGALTVACREGGAGAAFVAACLRAAATVRLRGARAFGLGADAAYGALLRTTLERLEKGRGAALTRLRAARTPDGQARRASRVAASYSAAARALARTPPNPLVREHNAAIRTALRKQAGRFADLGRAAARGRRRTYARAVAAIEKGDAALRVAVAALRELGFER